MNRFMMLILLICLGACATTTDQHDRSADGASADNSDAQHQLPPVPDHPQLNRFKSLAGKWAVTDENGQPTSKVAHYRLTAGGGTVVETMFPGTPHAMITMYHLDGDTLMLTHYCVLQNQPRMRERKSTNDRVIQFAFSDGTRMAATDVSHMHEVTFKFIDSNHFQATWTNYEKGKPAHGMTMNMVREGF